MSDTNDMRRDFEAWELKQRDQTGFWPSCFDAYQAATERATPKWLPIETAPKDGFMLVHEDGAIRARMRICGDWHNTSYPAIVSAPHGDVIVGADAANLLPTGSVLVLRDGCCENPTDWMPLPPPPGIRQGGDT